MTDGGTIEEIFPLSPMQQGLLFHSVSAADPTAYTVQVCCTVEGDLDAAALASAWRTVIALHPALRSDFDWEELDEPVQVVHRSLEVPVERREGALAEFLAEDRRCPFQLTAAPLLRLTLLREAGLQHLVWTYHHILLDGWSALLVLGQLFAAYRAVREGGVLRLEPPRRFSEYVAWLRQLDLGSAEAIWRRELRGFREPTPLPVRPVQGGECQGFGRSAVALAPDLLTRLRAFARRHRLTLNTLVQGAWALVLARVSGEEDLLFGAAAAGRPPELGGSESMVGLFLNTLPVRVRVPPAALLASWLAELQTRQLALRPAHHAPLAALQTWSELPRDRPLFESVLIFENHPVSGALREEADGIAVKSLRFSCPTHYPLALTVLPGAALDLEIGFDAGRIEGATAWALLTQLRNLLAALGEHDETPLDSLPALSPAERHQVLREGNDTAEEMPPEGTLHRWFERQAASSPGAVAVVSGGRPLSYAQLNAGANRLARHLLGLGVARGEPVAVCLARSERVPVALLAVLKAGGAYVPLDPAHPPERLAAMLAGSRARFVLTETAHARLFPAGLARLDVDELGSALAGESGEDLDLTAGSEDLAYVIFTSGSTGRPKGVAVPHGAVVNLLADFARRLALGPGRSLLAVTTFSFDIAGLELFLPLVTGARVILAPSEAAGDGRLLARLLAEGADVVQATPSTWFLLLAAGWQGDPRLTLLCGGEALPRPLAGRLLRRGAALYNLYGPTETTIWSLVARVEVGEGAVPIGRPLANTRAYLLDAHLQPLPAGLPGELYLGGGGLARGYFGLPAETAERFVPDPWGGEPGGRLYRTGDRVRRRPDGELEFLGRVDHQAKVRGFRVEPGEIEALLIRYPGIREAAVAARRDEDGGARLVAYLVPGEAPPSASALGQFLRERLPEPLVPSAFVFLPALPRTANEKVDRRSLPDPGRERPAVETVFHPPRTAVEERLARIWGAVLKLDRVGVFDNFFELGGDSIRSVQVVARAAQEGLRLTPDQIFARRTIAALAEIAGTEEALPEEVDGGLARADRGAHSSSAEIEALYPVSSIQQGMLFHSLLAPGSAIYFEQVACTLRGAFHAPLFHRAWKRAVERHPVLRSAFRWEGGEPRQAVFRRVELPWRSEDLRGLAAAERSARLEEILAADRRLGFDPEQAPLSRHTLIRLSADGWRWVWSFHHALLDGWSVALLLREVFAIYAGLCRGEVTPMPEPPAPDGYFAWLERRDRRAEEAYWRGCLAGLSAPTVLDLGGGQERGEGYGRQEIHLPAEETRFLLDAARRAGLTLHTVLQGAWALLIARYSGEAEVVFGTTSAGRPAELPGAESLIGLFVSTLPARVRVPATAEPLAWLQDLQQRQAEMRGFARTSLTEIQGWSEVPRGVPLFECVEVLENYPSDPVPERGLDGLQVSDLSLFERTNYPLSFMALPGPRLVLRLLYDRPRFEDGAMARMAGHLANLVQGLLAEPGRLADLPMLGEGERQQILIEWNDAGAPAGEGTVLDLFALQAARTPGALAVQEGDRELTYGELDRRSSRLAGSLAGRGIRPGDVVALSFHPGIEMVVGALGVVRAGAAYLPLDPETPAERLRMLLADSGAKTLIAADLDAEEPGGGCARLDPAQTAYVIYTSGSTGHPKGVAVSHAALLNLVSWHLRAYEMRPEDRMSLFANPAFDAAVWEIWPVLACGASLHAVPREVRSDPARLIPWLWGRRISICFLPTPLAELAVELPWPPDPALRVLLTGGDRLQRVPARPLPFRLVNHYGPTEAAVVTTAARVEPGPAAGPPPIGRPIANAAVHLLGHGLDPVPLGTPGELFIGGAVLAQGYLGRPDLTAAAFLPDPFSAVPGVRLYRTGDRARRRADGQLDFLGRLDRQVKVRGVRIEPREIETVLLGRPGVRQAVAIVREDRPGDRRLVAYVTAEPPAATGREELRGDLVASWRQLYDETYGGAPPADPGFDIVGWRSSYDGEPIPPEQMHEWVERTVERILSLRPRRVLEIGCGTGLLLFRLAPRCERYCGTDFSRPALDSIARQLGHAGLELPGLTLLERRADDLSDLAGEGFDLVILNSVVQYFPDEGYLERVLTAAAGVVEPGGAIFVGDVRSLPLLPAYCASVERLNAPPDLPLPELHRRVEQRVAEEEELAVDPRFFAAVAERIPGLGGAEVLLKRGRSANELVRYRYDVLLRKGERRAAEELGWICWEGNFDLPRLRRTLSEDRPPSLAISRVPDGRVTADLALLGARPQGEAEAAIDPEDLWELDREGSYTVWAGWSVSAAPGVFDVIFRRAGSEIEPGAILRTRGEEGTPRLTNDPLAARARQRLLSELREELRQALPGAMVPAEIVLLETLPVTPHGKVDLAALPPPPPRLSPPGASLPREPLEVELAALWSEVLGVEEVARDQSFFELGGHSLLAIRLISRVREALGIELTVASLFSAPTVAGVAQALHRRSREGGARDRELPSSLPSNNDERHLPFPLTPVQRGLWENRSEAAALAGGANVCFELAAVDPDGALVDRLNAALERLVARHEMLRAVVRADGRQEILPVVPACPVAVEDLRGVPPEAAAARRAAVREAFQNRVGQAGRWPLFELVAHRLDGGELRLQAWFDALILDGPSREIFCHELNRLIEDPAAALPPVSCSYRDYALAAFQQSDRTPRDGPAPPSPLLPAAGAGGRVPFVDRFAQLLDPGSWAALRAEAATAAVTPSALALGVFVELLARWSASPGFTLGLVSAYRPPVHPEIDRVIGNFTRLVPLAVDRWEGAFAERLHRLQERLSASLDDRWRGGGDLWPSVLFNSLLETTLPPFTPGAGARLETVEVGAYWPGALLVATVAEDAAGSLVCKWQAREASLPAGLGESLFEDHAILWRRLAATGVLDRSAGYNAFSFSEVPAGARTRVVSSVTSPLRIRRVLS